MKRKTIILSVGVVAVIGLGAFFAWPKGDGLKALAQKYDFTTVQRMDISQKVDATGKVMALEKKDLYADYEGTVEQVKVEAGSKVTKGDILVVIHSATLKAQWQDAQSALRQAELGLSQSASQVATELYVNQIQKSNALQLGTYSHQAAIYKEQVKLAKERVAAINAKNDGYYVSKNETLMIRAPFDGQIAWINIQPGDKITPQTLLATVMKPDALGVEAKVDQNDIGLVKTGQTAVVTGKDEKQSVNAGTVTEISNLGQNEGEDVVNYPVRIKMTEATSGLLPGMTVDVTVTAAEYSGALVVPAGSVIQEKGRDTVAVLRGKQLQTVPVKLGLKQGKNWQVVSGLRVGDQVAVAKPVMLAKSGSAPQNAGGPFGGR